MIINKKTIRKSLLRSFICSACCFVILSLTAWEHFFDEMYYIISMSSIAAIIICLFSLAELSDKERNRMELERQEKENKTTEHQTNFSDDIESKEV